MVETISNVLTGVATLEVGAPVGARAEWSDETAHTGSHSVKLSKPEIEGGYGSTHVEMKTAGTAAAALTMQDFEDQGGAAGEWGWWKYRSAIAAYWEMMELRFEDPNSDSWVDITVQVDVMELGAAIWEEETLSDASLAFFGGWSELDGSKSDYAPQAISGLVAAIATELDLQHAVTGVGTWLLTRVRIELWETVWGRHVYIDSVNLNSVNYNFEPGDTGTPAIRLSAPFTEVGYTEDGVTVTYTPTVNPIRVEEETFPIDFALDEESAEVTCNMAESSLFNMDKAMAGSLLSGSILKLGAGTLKKLTLQVHGTNPAGETRSILIPSCVATGAVGMPYKKGEKTVVPVTFQALKTAGHPAVTIVDNAA